MRIASAVGALVVVCAIWGFTFVIVKRAIETIPPFEFLAIRFAIAALLLMIVFPRQVAAIRGETFRGGVAAGIALAVGYGFQTVGLQFTGATNAGFVTGIFVILAPLLGIVLLRKAPNPKEWLAVAAAATGLALLTLGPRLDVRRGDMLVLVTAISFAVHIVLLGRFSVVFDSRQLAILQLGVAAAGFTLISLASEKLVAPRSGSVWFALVVTSVGASAFGFLVQTWAQTHLDLAQTAVTLTMEPVFAGLAGFFLLDERLNFRGWIGAALILGGMLLASAEPDRARPKRRTAAGPATT